MCAAAHDLAPVFDAWMRVAVANHNARRVEPFIFKDGQLRQANIALHRVGGDRRAGAQCGTSSGTEDALLLRGDPRLIGADLADDPRSERSVDKFLHDLVGEIVDGAAINARLGGVVGLAVPAGTGHDVQPGRL